MMSRQCTAFCDIFAMQCGSREERRLSERLARWHGVPANGAIETEITPIAGLLPDSARRSVPGGPVGEEP